MAISFSLNDAEQEILFALCSETFCVYLFLKKNMEHHTKLVKNIDILDVRKFLVISEGDKKHHRKLEDIRDADIENALEELHEVGLIEKRDDLGEFVFECVLSDETW
jgi:site-specific recombinase XerD